MSRHCPCYPTGFSPEVYDGLCGNCPLDCYSARRGRACLLCEDADCGNCPECSPEVPD